MRGSSVFATILSHKRTLLQIPRVPPHAASPSRAPSDAKHSEQWQHRKRSPRVVVAAPSCPLRAAAEGWIVQLK